MPSDMQSAQGRGRSRDRTAERVGLTRHTTRGGSSRALEERYKCMRCNCMCKGSCSGSVRVTHDVPHAGGSPCEVAASGRCRWQPLQGGQPVSQSVSRGKAAHVCGRKDVSKGGSRQPPRSPVVAQWHSCSNVEPTSGRPPNRVHTSVNGLSRRDPERPSRGAWSPLVT